MLLFQPEILMVLCQPNAVSLIGYVALYLSCNLVDKNFWSQNKFQEKFRVTRRTVLYLLLFIFVIWYFAIIYFYRYFVIIYFCLNFGYFPFRNHIWYIWYTKIKWYKYHFIFVIHWIPRRIEWRLCQLCLQKENQLLCLQYM